MRSLITGLALTFALVSPAFAHGHHHRVHRGRHVAHRAVEPASESFSSFVAPHQTLWWDHSGSKFNTERRSRRERVARRSFRDGRPRAWCGWYMRHLLGVADPSYNLARNWAHWGHAGAPGIGAVVVWPHHVGKIVGRDGGQWVIESGNDGHRVRTRPRSISGAIAFRWG